MTPTNTLLVAYAFSLTARAALAQPVPASSGATPAGSSVVAPGVLPGTGEVLDFTPEAKLLYRIGACAGDAPLPARFDARALAHCKKLRPEEDAFKKTWIDRARPFLAAIRPHDLPRQVVYPFGGGDLLIALVTYPDAAEITTLSLEPAGDPRPIDTIAPDLLAASLDVSADKLIHLFHFAHSLTTDLSTVSRRNRIPGELIDALTGLYLNGYEPVSLRYFLINADGGIRYLTSGDVAASDAIPDPRARPKVFANMELRFQPIGGGGDGAVRIHRHIGANLDDKHLKADGRIITFLEAKGRVAAMTKAASFLLWWAEFSVFRNYLLKNMEWMISDATGIPPRYVRPAGFVQETWGAFVGPLLPQSGAETEEFTTLWKKNPRRPLTFMYGYPDNNHHPHMLVTRKAPRN